MKYLTIDTCSWRKLVKVDEINPFLEDLKFWIKNNHIKIIVPEPLIEEWKKHRDKELKEKFKELKNISKSIKAYTKKRYPFLGEIEIDENIIKKQIEIIDNIIFNSEIKINVSDNINNKIVNKQRAKPRKAPFHYKIESVNDAIIYFSSVEYCHNNDINRLIFISDNKNDYGKPLGNKTGSPNEIHPELLEDFPNIDVQYFTYANQAISKLKEELPSRQESVSSQAQENNIEDDFFTINNNDLSVQEQLYIRFKKIEEEINFLPVQILKDISPFKIDNEKNTYHNNFTLITNNEALFNYLEEIVGKVKNEEKINEQEEYILKSLSDNLIFNIQLAESHRYINVFYSNQEKSDCLFCTFYRFEFHKTFIQLEKETSNLKNQLKTAYIHYQIGNYLKAANLYFKIRELAEKQDKKLILFISHFNLSKLQIFIRNRYFGNAEAESVLKKIKSLNINDVALKIDIKRQNKFIKRIVSHDFIVNSIFNILDYSNKIIDHYYSQLNGGWSENSYIISLIYKFAELDTFLNSNYIIYDNFKEFKTLFRRVLEGFFASHAISEKQCQRFETFDDYWVSKIVYYSNKNDILKFFKRYNLKELKYKKSSKNDDSFYNMISNILSVKDDLRESFKEHCETEYNSFWERYDKIFENLFTLASLLDIDKTTINSITKKIIEFLSDGRMVGRNTADALKTFFAKRGKDIDEELLIEVFNLAESNTLLHDKNFIEIILNEIGEKNKVIDVSDKYVKDFIHNCLTKCDKCKTTHSQSELIAFFKVVNKKQQEIIKYSIEKALKEKCDFDLFYQSTLFDVIDFNIDYFNKFIKQFSPKKEYSDKEPRFFNYERYHIRIIDDLINLGFKNDIDFSDNKFDLLRNYHPYYKWLFDMDNFKYSDFDIDWVAEYETLYYLKKMAKSDKLIKYLTEYLKHNVNKLVEKIFFNIVHIYKN